MLKYIHINISSYPSEAQDGQNAVELQESPEISVSGLLERGREEAGKKAALISQASKAGPQCQRV